MVFKIEYNHTWHKSTGAQFRRTLEAAEELAKQMQAMNYSTTIKRIK